MTMALSIFHWLAIPKRYYNQLKCTQGFGNSLSGQTPTVAIRELIKTCNSQASLDLLLGSVFGFFFSALHSLSCCQYLLHSFIQFFCCNIPLQSYPECFLWSERFDKGTVGAVCWIALDSQGSLVTMFSFISLVHHLIYCGHETICVCMVFWYYRIEGGGWQWGEVGRAV